MLMCSSPAASSSRARANGPASTGRRPPSSMSFETVAFASTSSEATKTSSDSSATRPSRSVPAKVAAWTPRLGLRDGSPTATMKSAPMTRELLSAEDMRILALESGTVRGHTCKVFVIAGERSAEEVRAHLQERLGVVPQLMRRLDPGVGQPAWNDDPGFSLEGHVIDRGALDDAGLRQLVARAMATSLDRD